MNEHTKTFIWWLIRLTGRAYAAFIITVAVVAGIFAGLRAVGIVRPRVAGAAQHIERMQIQHEQEGQDDE